MNHLHSDIMKSHSQIHILNPHKWQTHEMPTMKVIYGIKNSLNLG